MIIVKRYENRKLYNTNAKAYVSLAKVANMIRRGDQVQVIDNVSGEDISAQVLTQIILEEGKKGATPISSATLHELIRWGNDVVESSLDQVSDGVDRLIHQSVRRLFPVADNAEVEQLKTRVKELESAVEKLLNQLSIQQ